MRRLLALLALAGVLLLVSGTPASAHSSLLSSDPEAGSVVEALPETIILTFNEPVQLDGVEGFAADGSAWEVEATGSDNRVDVTPVGDPGLGTVTLAWSVVSEDGHVVSGSLAFSIGAATAAAPAPATPSLPLVGASALALAVSIGLGLAGRRAELLWTAGLLLAAGVVAWAWVDGELTAPALLLLAAYAVSALVRTVRRRVVAALLVVPVVALLGGAAYAWPEAPRQPDVASADLGSDGTVEVTATPGASQTVTLEVRLTDDDGAALAPYAPPTLSLSGPVSLGDVELSQTAPGTYRGDVTVPTDGTWEASVSVRTSEFDNPVAVVELEID